MPDTGLAHDHLWLTRTDGERWVARLPKQSQMDLAAESNLHYQSECFRRASRGGSTPTLHTVLPISHWLPRGGLLVSGIVGRTTTLPDDLPAIATCLASLHRQPLPAIGSRAPLLSPDSPWQAMHHEILQQAEFLSSAHLTSASRRMIDRELEALNRVTPSAMDAQRTLISFDAHPGNFLVTALPEQRGVLVELEKCRYSLLGLGLAHASLYTSTTWDVSTHAVLSSGEVADFYAHWRTAMAAVKWAIATHCSKRGGPCGCGR